MVYFVGLTKGGTTPTADRRVSPARGIPAPLNFALAILMNDKMLPALP